MGKLSLLLLSLEQCVGERHTLLTLTPYCLGQMNKLTSVPSLAALVKENPSLHLGRDGTEKVGVRELPLRMEKQKSWPCPFLSDADQDNTHPSPFHNVQVQKK